MKQFFKFMLASMVGMILAWILIFFISFAIIAGMIASAGKDEVSVPDHAILEVRFANEIKERTSENPFEGLNFGFDRKRDLGLNDILKNFEKAKVDDQIKGVFMDLSSIDAGMAQLEEIRDALIDFRESKKFVYAYSEDFNQGTYYLASVADKIYLHPQGSFDWHGFSTELIFLKGTLEKLEIEPEVIRHGKFKSAIEPFVNNKMSPENKEQISRLIHSIWDYYVGQIAKSRNLDENVLKADAYNLSVRFPEDALEKKYVDMLAYYDEVQSDLKKACGVEQKEKIPFISMRKYHKAEGNSRPFSNKKIAVIYATGEIHGGEGNENTIGSDKISATIRKARLDTSIKAIVLRVNSPGGSALASEVIWREMELAKKEKPVIVSMSDLAASGGYYIACGADTIVCEPNTLTGSIGVFGLLFNAQKMFNNKLGITFDTVKTGRFGQLGSFSRPLTQEERDIIQQQVERIYDTFIMRVSAGRNMSKELVDSIGQGRVWSGIDAKRLGLVDVLGGIQTAVEIAAKKAGLEKYRIIQLPEQEDVLQKIIEDFSADATRSSMENKFGAGYNYLEQVSSALTQQGILARMPFEIRVY